MLIVLPPSETKAPGGEHPAIAWEELSFPTLDAPRRAIAADLVQVCSAEPDRAREVLGLSEKLRPEVEANAVLESAPTMPALLRYTGVLYDALDAPTLGDAAWERLAIGSALFGLLSARDRIPHYRLSGGTKLPHGAEMPTMKKRWGKAISAALGEVATEEMVVDLRSGTYQQLGRCPQAVTVRVESVQPDGSRKVVSHFNKHYKGQLARALAQADGEATSLDDAVDLSRAAGFTVEAPATNGREITLVV